MRLTPFEEYMYYDDRVAYPMEIFVHFRLTGEIDREKLETAFCRSLLDHPLFRSSVVCRRGRLYWHCRDDLQCSIDWDVESRDDGLPLTILPLEFMSGGAGARLYVCTEGEQVMLTLQVHHACCDGIGACRFLSDMLIEYDRLVSGEESSEVNRAKRSEEALHKLKSRGRMGLTWSWFLRYMFSQLSGFLGAWQFFSRRPISLADSSRADEGSAGSCDKNPAMRRKIFTAEETTRLIAEVKSQGLTLTEKLLYDLHRAISEWVGERTNDDGADGLNDPWVRISLPISLRTPRTESIPSANVVSMVFFDRRSSDLVDRQRGQQGLKEQLRVILRRKLGYMLIWSLFISRFLPGGIKKTVRDERRPVSSILTNLGKDFLPHFLSQDSDGCVVVGRLRLEACRIIPPLRPGTHVGFSISTYAKRLAVDMHYDRANISPVHADQMLAKFVSHIDGTSEQGDGLTSDQGGDRI